MINTKNTIKYLIIMIIVSASTFYIPGCSIINEHAFYIGLLAATTFAILDRYFPHYIFVEKKDDTIY